MGAATVALAAVSGLWAPGCSDGGSDASRRATDGGADSASEPPPRECPFPGSTEGPAVSFRDELMPFFSVSCAFLGCHDGVTRLQGLYLGPNHTEGAPSADEVRDVHASLLAQSTVAPGLARVVPGDPTRSFVMLKLDGCQNAVGLSCLGAIADKPCGLQMPAQSDELPLEDRDRFRRWIAQGAPGP